VGVVRLVVALAIALIAGLQTMSGHAAEATAQPQSISLPPLTATEPVLSIVTPAGSRSFSLVDLEALGLWQVSTSTFWPDDQGPYAGPLLADVLRLGGLADASAVRIAARDGFSQVIPRSDWERWPILLATRRAGQPMVIRDKGPMRIIYPRDMSDELKDTKYRLRWIWLVSRIEAAAQ